MCQGLANLAPLEDANRSGDEQLERLHLLLISLISQPHLLLILVSQHT